MPEPDAAAPEWYVWALGRPWGPYPPRRIADFVQEGRVAPATLIGAAPEGPFRPAAEVAPLRALFAPDQAAPPDAEEGGPVAPTPSPSVAQQTVAAARPLLVFAALLTLDPVALEAALAIHGPYDRIGRSLWLIRARMGAAGLRNALSRRLRAGDALLVVEAPLEQAAWFNLDPSHERRLRALWAGV